MRQLGDLAPLATTWISTVADWASIAGIFGLAATFVQLLRTKSAVSAAQRAISRTEAHLAMNQTLILLPQLQKLEDDLDAAVDGGHQDAALRHLGQWRSVAMEIYGLIKEQPYAEPRALPICGSRPSRRQLPKAN